MRRRLNRIEYENTVRDLLHIDVELKELLAMDSSPDGFDNVGDALHISSFLMERYLEAADAALERGDRQRSAAAADQETLQPEGNAPGQIDDRETCFASMTKAAW